MTDSKKGFFSDWKVHVVCLGLVLIAELIGTRPFRFPITESFALAFSLFPMLYVLIIGMIMGVNKLFSSEMMATASPYIGISVTWLTCKTASTIGPNLDIVITAGPALLLQKLGQIAPPLLAIPVAIFIFRMGRQAVGASFSTSRENSIAIIGSMYGLDAPEGQGIMGAYITGTVLGTVFCAILSSIVIALNIFDPVALAMASGVGSASMMTASLGALTAAFPDRANELTAYTSSSQILGSVTTMYLLLFACLPLTNKLYSLLGGQKIYEAATARKAAKAAKSGKSAPAEAVKSEAAATVQKPAAPSAPKKEEVLFDPEYWFLQVKILIISGLFATIGNFISSYKSTKGEAPVMPWEIFGVMGFMLILILAGIFIDRLARIKIKLNLPAILYISIFGLVFSIPGMPFQEFYVTGANKIPLLPLCTPILAYAGISLGRDWDDFKRQGVGIVVVALCTFVAIYIGPAIIAQIVLSVTGQI